MHIFYVFFAVPPASHVGASEVAKIIICYLVFTATIVVLVTKQLDVVSACFFSMSRTRLAFSNGGNVGI